MRPVRFVPPSDVLWNPHPQYPGVRIANLLAHEADSSEITCALVHLPVGSQTAEHLHEHSDDILYVLRGKAKMRIRGWGDVPLVAGNFLRIPRRTLHQPIDIEEDVVAYDVWSPHL